MDSELDRQQTEIYALKSIYGNDFIESEPPRAWKVCVYVLLEFYGENDDVWHA